MQKTSKFILGNTLILIPFSLVLVMIPDGLGLVYAIIASVSGGLMFVYHFKLTKHLHLNLLGKHTKLQHLI